MEQEVITYSQEIVPSESLQAMTRVESDVQIATAKQYPRSIDRFLKVAEQMATSSQDVASSCFYAIPRGGKKIEGPTARFAEIVLSAWQNASAGARIIGYDRSFITAQAVFKDLENNTSISFEVKRRITDRNGKTYNEDMIAVTGNAAMSIAVRNAILKGIPPALWTPIYEKSRRVSVGNGDSLDVVRQKLIEHFRTLSIKPEQIFKLMNVEGEDDLGVNEIITLRGIANAIKDGDTTAENVFRGTVSFIEMLKAKVEE